MNIQEEGFRTFTCVDHLGDTHLVTTWRDETDQCDRVIAISSRFTRIHKVNASVGHEWELAIEGVGEYIPTIAQTWVKSYAEGDIFSPSDYLVILDGFVPVSKALEIAKELNWKASFIVN